MQVKCIFYARVIVGAHYIGNEIMPTIISSPFIFIITKAGPTYYVRNGVSLGSYSLLKSY